MWLFLLILYFKGISFLLMKNYKRALPYFEKVTHELPRFSKAYFNLIDCYTALKRYEEALKTCERLINMKPRLPKAYLYLGIIRFDSEGEDICESIEAFKKAISINPNYADAYYHLGNSYGAMGCLDEAIEALRQVTHIEPDADHAYYLMWRIYQHLERYSEAINCCNEMIRINSKDYEAYFFLGRTYIKLKQYEKAIEAIKEVIRIKLNCERVGFNEIITSRVVEYPDAGFLTGKERIGVNGIITSRGPDIIKEVIKPEFDDRPDGWNVHFVLGKL